jgi:hypothetical protein
MVPIVQNVQSLRSAQSVCPHPDLPPRRGKECSFLFLRSMKEGKRFERLERLERLEQAHAN